MLPLTQYSYILQSYLHLAIKKRSCQHSRDISYKNRSNGHKTYTFAANYEPATSRSNNTAVGEVGAGGVAANKITHAMAK